MRGRRQAADVASARLVSRDAGVGGGDGISTDDGHMLPSASGSSTAALLVPSVASTGDSPVSGGALGRGMRHFDGGVDHVP